MPERTDLLAKIAAALRDDIRVHGCLTHGARPVGYACRWSELKLAVYVRSNAFEAFRQDWKRLAAPFGARLWEQFSSDSQYCACFDLNGLPLFAEFTFVPWADFSEIPQLPPGQNFEMLYDGTNGVLVRSVRQQMQKRSPQGDARAAFGRLTLEFWRAIYVTRNCLLDGDFWEARQTFHIRALPKLVALLRVENGDLGNQRDDNSTVDLVTALSGHRFAQLNRCIPEADNPGLEQAVLAAAELGLSVCSEIASKSGGDWPEALANRILTMPRPWAASETLRLRPIGVVENQIDDLLPPDAIKAVASRIHIYPEYSEGLEGLNGGQRLLVIFHFHRLSGYELRQHPRNDASRPKRGVFALHSPRRPNPIGVTEVELVQRDGNILIVNGLDAVNGTPVLDLKLNS